MKRITFGVVAMAIALVSGCLPDESACTKVVDSRLIFPVDKNRLQQDVATITAYLNDNDIQNVITESNGVRYTIDVAGTGPTPCLESLVTVKYRGTLMSNGTEFDKSDNPVNFRLFQLILGWQLVLPNIAAGSTVTLYIPSGLAYGPQGNSPIPANANLIFELELLGVN